MKWMLIAVQAFVVMFCLAYGSDVRAEITEKVPEVTILLERMYVDGEVSEEILTEKVADLEKQLVQEQQAFFMQLWSSLRGRQVNFIYVKQEF